MKPVWRFLDWLGRHELGVLFAALGVAAGAWAFAALADEVGEGGTQRFDRAVLVGMRRANPPDLSVPLGPPWLADTARDITALGSATVLALAVSAVAGFLLIRRELSALGLILTASVGGLVLTTALKGVFARPRPSIVPHLANVRTESFPSGHSLLSAVVYLTLGSLLTRLVGSRRLKVYFLLLALILTLGVGVSRVYLGVHYPTDVLAGWAVGLAWAILCWLVARYLQRRGEVTRDLGQTPPTEPG